MDALILILVGAGAIGIIWYMKWKRWSFSAQRPVDYDITTPRFDLRRHLNGPMICEGVIYGPDGRVTSRFEADLEATWNGNTGRMTEDFRYDSGATQSREWRLKLADDGSITAEADDVVGQGKGQQAGCSVLLNYRLKLPDDAGGHVLDATDWMYILGNGTIVNRSQFRKFGIKAAELVATIRPKEV